MERDRATRIPVPWALVVLLHEVVLPAGLLEPLVSVRAQNECECKDVRRVRDE